MSRHTTAVHGNQGGVYAYCYTCRKTLLQGDHELRDYNKACEEHQRENITATLLLTGYEAENLIEDLRHAANYGTEWDNSLNSFADSLQRQLDYDVRALRFQRGGEK